jgi:pimeloyl-ACP methyl ester carboxylesterase
MPRSGGGHPRCDPDRLPHAPAALVTATSLVQTSSPPTFEQFRRSIANAQTEDIARDIYDGLVCESGRYLWELLLAVPRLSTAAVVDFAAVTTPVLVMGAECDRMVPAGVVRQTAARYQRGTPLRFPVATTWCFGDGATRHDGPHWRLDC